MKRTATFALNLSNTRQKNGRIVDKVDFAKFSAKFCRGVFGLNQKFLNFLLMCTSKEKIIILFVCLYLVKGQDEVKER